LVCLNTRLIIARELSRCTVS
ncbi:hypothetical protein KIPB_015708, partial [Kipferlia bialata]